MGSRTGLPLKLETSTAQFRITVEGADIEECFKKMAEAQELFIQSDKCGKTGHDDVILRVRTSGDYEFSEFFCPSSGCTLQLGRTKAGGYFVKKKDKAGNWLPNGGWLDWKERKALQEGSKPVAANDDYDPNF